MWGEVRGAGNGTGRKTDIVLMNEVMAKADRCPRRGDRLVGCGVSRAGGETERW